MDDLSAPQPSGSELEPAKKPRKPRPSEIAAKKEKKAAKKPAKPKKAKKPAPKKKAAKKSKRPKVKTMAAVARSERLDMRLTKGEKSKVHAKAQKLRRTVTSIVIEAIEKIK